MALAGYDADKILIESKWNLNIAVRIECAKGEIILIESKWNLNVICPVVSVSLV